MQADQNNQLLMRHVFFPTFERRSKEFSESGRQLAYYTSADTAIKILESKKLWLRNTGVMNDSNEVVHGATLVSKALKSEPGREFLQAFDECFNGISKELIQKSYEWLPLILGDTFITSFSEHPVTPEEAVYGRLSMWRAYGVPNGVALIFNSDALFQDFDNAGAYISSVEYINDTEVGEAFFEVANRIRQYKENLQALGREHVLEAGFKALRYAAICLKHPAFKEEVEWRLIASTSNDVGNPYNQGN